MIAAHYGIVQLLRRLILIKSLRNLSLCPLPLRKATSLGFPTHAEASSSFKDLAVVKLNQKNPLALVEKERR